jgi:hypothetical protein
MIGIYELLGDMHDVANAQVARLSEFEERNGFWRKLGFKEYADYQQHIDCSGRVREMIREHNISQEKKERATKRLGGKWHNSPELLEILNDSHGCEKWMRLSALAEVTEHDPELAKQCLNRAYVDRVTKLDRKVNKKWFTSADFREARHWVAKKYLSPHLNLGRNVDYAKLGLKFYRGLLMPVTLYPGKEDRLRVRTVTPSHGEPFGYLPPTTIPDEVEREGHSTGQELFMTLQRPEALDLSRASTPIPVPQGTEETGIDDHRDMEEGKINDINAEAEKQMEFDDIHGMSLASSPLSSIDYKLAEFDEEESDIDNIDEEKVQRMEEHEGSGERQKCEEIASSIRAYTGN